MAADTVFDKLVSALSRDERRDMLERIQRTVSVEVSDAAFDEGEEDTPVDFDLVYRSLPLLRKLIVLVQVLITGRTREELVHAHLLRQLAADIRTRYPGLVDFRLGMMLTPMYEHLLRLQESSHFFAGPIGRAGGKDRPAFLSFLLALEAPDVQLALERAVDVEEADEEGADEPSTQVRHRMVNNVQQALDTVPDPVRHRMRQGNRFLDVMGRLSFFPFEKLLTPFRPFIEGGDVQASLLNMRETFPELAPIARSLDVTPSAACLEGLILFHQGYQFADTVDGEVMTRQVRKAATHLKTISEVFAQVPVPDLSRYILGDVNFTAPRLQGGEEWIAIVRRFWRERADEAYRAYKYRRGKTVLVRDAAELTGVHTLNPIADYPALEGRDEGRYATSLALIRAILDGAWQHEIIPPLKALFIEGEFYKDDNRAEFSDAYTTLFKLIDKIDGFRTRVSMQGDLGRALHDLELEAMGVPEKRRQRQEIIAQVDEHAETLIKSALNSFSSLTRILNGVLYGEVGGRYDTLSNIRDIGGRHNRSWLASLERAAQHCQAALDVVSRLFDLERAHTQSATYSPIPNRV